MKTYQPSILLILLLCLCSCMELYSQRMPHGRQAYPQSRGGAMNRPSTINGGAHRSPNRSHSNNRATTQKVSRPSTGNKPSRNTSGSNISRDRSRDKKPSTKRSNVNIDNSKRNVNLDNSKTVNINRNNTVVVRPAPRPYVRPPYHHGGFYFYSYHPYYYHPYRPYYWGPVWHPWGFFVAAMATTAIIVSVENQQYHYDQGVYYTESNDGYVVVAAPVGATISTLPEGSQTVVINETTTNYYYGGTYYEQSDGGYTVVPPTAGTVVEHLPQGAEEVKVGDQTYVKYGETYYQPVQVDGNEMYEVAEVTDEAKQ